MTLRKNQKITVATTETLACEHYYRRLWIATRNMSIPRREWLNEIADALRDYDGMIVDDYERRFSIPLVDEVFGDDPDMRWISYYMRPDDSGEHPVSKSRKFKRLQLIDLYFKIRHPDIAQHFGR